MFVMMYKAINEYSGLLLKKPSRVSTGIKQLDKLSGGGYKPNSTNLLIGGSGTAKTIFSVQFLIEGIKNN